MPAVQNYPTELTELSDLGADWWEAGWEASLERLERVALQAQRLAWRVPRPEGSTESPPAEGGDPLLELLRGDLGTPRSDGAQV